MMKSRPRYSTEEVARLVVEGKLSSARTVVNFLIDHDYDASEVTAELLTTLGSRGEFVKSLTLKSGAIADVYQVLDSDDTEWYLKFYVDDGQLVVLLSCWWDGCVH
jgi:hypothetical protein